MHLWALLGVCGICFIILEIFTPSMFFLNFALAAFFCAVLSVFTSSMPVLVITFFVMSFLSFAFLRPIIVKKFDKKTETGINSKYIGKVAKANEEINEYNGSISLYGERWDARSDDGSTIPSGSEVKIVRNESIIMYVEKV